MNTDLIAHEWLLLAKLIERLPLQIETIELRLPDGSRFTLRPGGGELSPPSGSET